MMMFLLLAALTAATPVAGPPARYATASDCGDLLARIHRKPAGAIYIGCSYQSDRQGKPLEATYRVRGRDAAATEAYLVRTIGLDRLKRLCCHWESPARAFRDPQGRDYSISLASEETVVASRDDWARIDTFEITVETMTEEI
jgi:hypothetical protein